MNPEGDNLGYSHFLTVSNIGLDERISTVSVLEIDQEGVSGVVSEDGPFGDIIRDHCLDIDEHETNNHVYFKLFIVVCSQVNKKSK